MHAILNTSANTIYTHCIRIYIVSLVSKVHRFESYIVYIISIVS